MSNTDDATHAKMLAIFRELAGDRACRLDGARLASEAVAKMGTALPADYPPQVASDIAFHLGDWSSDAAFLVALHLFPERFTEEEVAHGVSNLVVHVPNHLAAAAKLAGHPVEDIFGVGALRSD